MVITLDSKTSYTSEVKKYLGKHSGDWMMSTNKRGAMEKSCGKKNAEEKKMVKH